MAFSSIAILLTKRLNDKVCALCTGRICDTSNKLYLEYLFNLMRNLQNDKLVEVEMHLDWRIGKLRNLSSPYAVIN